MGSKFKGLFDAARERTPDDGPATAPSDDPPATPVLGADPPAVPRPLGRPRGKRSDPTYEQITAYVRKETYRALKIKLLTSGDERDASEVIEDLISAWLAM